MNKQTLKTTIMVKKETEMCVQVQICPICGGVPRVVGYDKRTIHGEESREIDTAILGCSCGLQARLRDWNKLSYGERDDEKSEVPPDENDVFINSAISHFLARYGIQGDNSHERLKYMKENGYIVGWEKTNIVGTYKYVLYKGDKKIAELYYKEGKQCK